MSASWKIASMVVLPLSLALAATGCMAQAADEEANEGSANAEPVATEQAPLVGNEQTGEATEACGGFGGWGGGFGGWGGGFGGGCGGFGGWGGGFGGGCRGFEGGECGPFFPHFRSGCGFGGGCF